MTPAPKIIKPRKPPVGFIERMFIRGLPIELIDDQDMWWKWRSGFGRMWNYIGRWEADRRSF